MSLPTSLKFSARLNYTYGKVSLSTGTPRLPHSAEAEHAEATHTVATLMQAVYDLAGELRGMGPIAHQSLRNANEPSVKQRLNDLLASINDLQSAIAGARDSHVYRQVKALGISEHSRDLRLHIGCGGHHIPGWINLDNYPAPLAVNVQRGIPLPNRSARYVFLSHLLEHLFYPDQSDCLLSEIRRVLAPDGVVRIVVPDIEQCINAYVANDREFFAARRKHWTWLPSDMTRLESFLAYAGVGPTPRHLFENHKFGYDFETLHSCLVRAGFVNVRRCRFQESPHEPLRVDHESSNAQAQHSGGHYSLFVEAQAPS